MTLQHMPPPGPPTGCKTPSAARAAPTLRNQRVRTSSASSTQVTDLVLSLARCLGVSLGGEGTLCAASLALSDAEETSQPPRSAEAGGMITPAPPARTHASVTRTNRQLQNRNKSDMLDRLHLDRMTTPLGSSRMGVEWTAGSEAVTPGRRARGLLEAQVSPAGCNGQRGAA